MSEAGSLQWPKVGLEESKWKYKKLKKLYIMFQCYFFAIFDKHVIIYCVLSMFQSRYLLQETWCFLSWKTTRCNKDWPKMFFFYHFCMAVTIFKAATSLSIFLTIRHICFSSLFISFLKKLILDMAKFVGPLVTLNNRNCWNVRQNCY